MYHSASAPSDADSRKVIGKHFVCCLLILMLDHYTTEQFAYSYCGGKYLRRVYQSGALAATYYCESSN